MCLGALPAPGFEAAVFAKWPVSHRPREVRGAGNSLDAAEPEGHRAEWESPSRGPPAHLPWMLCEFPPALAALKPPRELPCGQLSDPFFSLRI